MYEVAGSLTPESYESLATAVFMEMAMAGVTTVGEFHYIHHQMGGVPYSDRNEMGHALIRAARRAGIRISLLDAGYFTAGFKDEPLSPVQTRFSDKRASDWLDRVAELRTVYEADSDVVVGLAPHSVRAVPEAVLVEVADWVATGTPLHIHVSEQPAENRECLESTTLTPTALLDRVGLLGPDTTLVHATHVTGGDIEHIAGAAADVCYCATTERDLADGLGPAAELASAGVPLCVGSDSHAVIDLFEEARGIELHTRLRTGRRGVFAPYELMEAATVSGSASLGFPTGGLAEGAPADYIVIDPDSPRLAGLTEDTALDMTVFAATSADVRDVFVAGRPIVTDGAHHGWADARTGFETWHSTH
jgi:formiminoglutamate deiminase